MDIWHYIERENIDIPDLYFAAKRTVVERDGALIMIDDKRLKLAQSEIAVEKMVRFRSLGCYPLTGAVISEAASVPQIIDEMSTGTLSERSGRLIDQDTNNTMEAKKTEGYF